MTPLGSPVLPLEKMMVARSSREPGAAPGVEDEDGDDSDGFPSLSDRSIMEAGIRQAMASAVIFSTNPGFAASSSSKIVSQGTLSFSFSRNTFDVTTVLIPHC